MDLYKAMLVAECTEEEVSLLEKDDNFLHQVEVQYALEEYDLLVAHKTAIDISKNRGNAAPIQWKLSKLNKGRWDSKENVEDGFLNGNIQVNLIGKNNE